MSRFGFREALGVSVLAATALSAVACPFSSIDRLGSGGGGASSGTSDGGSGAGTGSCVGPLCVNGSGGCGASCSGGTKGAGETCGKGSECASGFCVDGVCCDAACDGDCEACAEALTGVDDGTCAPVMLGSVATGECSEKGGCGVGNKCRCEDGEKNGDESSTDCGGDCSACLVGAGCVVAEDCATGVCHNSTCCEQGACGECFQCASSGANACVPVTLASDGECSSNLTCSADLACARENGVQCSVAAQCASKFCREEGQQDRCRPCTVNGDCAANASDKLCSGGWCKRPVDFNCTTDLNCVTNRCTALKCKGCDADGDCASGKCDTTSHYCLLALGNPCSNDGDCASTKCEQGVCAP